MKPLFLLLLFSISSHATSSLNCPASRCTPNGPSIRFPFYLSDPTRCGYPGFQLSCDKSNETIVTLPNSGRFTVTRIDYVKQSIYINDPNRCLANRILNNINLTGSPFHEANIRIYHFYNCSYSDYEFNMSGLRLKRIPCLSDKNGGNFTVGVTESIYHYYVTAGRVCTNVKSVSAPVETLFYRYHAEVDLTEDLMLTWRDPACGACEAAGGRCGWKNGGTEEVKCESPRKANYAIAIGLVVFGLTCLVGFLLFIRYKFRARDANPQMSETITPQPDTVMGQNGPTINSYPKTVLNDSGRLSKPNDGMCAICLAEYMPNEILRSISVCNHYFHASCIDEWFKMNDTCPLCRKSPSRLLA